MSTPTSKVEALREQILNDTLIHELECDSSLYGTACNCIQQNVATNLLKAFATFLEELELPEKEQPLYGDGWEDWSEGVMMGRNDCIDDTRTLIQEQVKELRKI